MAEVTFGNEEFELIENGTYEVVIDRIDKKPYVKKDTNENMMGARVCFKIREGYNNGKFENRTVWQFVGADKTNPSEWADNRVLGSMIRTQDPMSINENGKPEWKFADFDACIQYLIGAKMLVTIEKTFDDYRGSDVNQIKPYSYAKSKNVNSVIPEKTIDPNDLPF